MTIAVREKVEGIRKVLQIWDRISKRLPATYPAASLVIHMSEEELEAYYWEFYECTKKEREEYPPYAFCDGDTNTIHVHATMAEQTTKEIARYLLHEEGHLYAFQRYGVDDPRTNDKNAKIDEAYADRFAARWIRRLRNEGWFS
jgi:hypothetical protein